MKKFINFSTVVDRPKPLPIYEQKVEVTRLKERTQEFDQLAQKLQVQKGTLPKALANIQPRNLGITDVTSQYQNKGKVASNYKVYQIVPQIGFPKPVREDKTRDVFGYRQQGFHKILSRDRDLFLIHRDDKRNKSVIDTRLDQGLKKPIVAPSTNLSILPTAK